MVRSRAAAIVPGPSEDASSPGTISAGAESARLTILPQPGTRVPRVSVGGSSESYSESKIRLPWVMSR